MTYGSHFAGTSHVDLYEPPAYCARCGTGLTMHDINQHMRICQWCAQDDEETTREEYAHDDIGKED